MKTLSLRGLLDVRHQLAAAWRAAIAKQPAQADGLRAQLRTKELELKAASQVGGDLYSTLVPAVFGLSLQNPRTGPGRRV